MTSSNANEIPQVKPLIKISYDAFTSFDDPNEVFKPEGIDEFEIEIQKHYDPIIKPVAVGRGGIVYDFCVEIIQNISWAGLVEMMLKHYAGKGIHQVMKAVIFQPFLEAFRKLKGRNEIYGIYTIIWELNDLKINLYNVNSKEFMIDEVLEEIFKALESNYPIMKNEAGMKPIEIFIPVLEDTHQDDKIFRVPLGMEDDVTKLDRLDFMKYWGISFPMWDFRVLDLIDKKLLTNEFYDEERFYSSNH